MVKFILTYEELCWWEVTAELFKAAMAELPQEGVVLVAERCAQELLARGDGDLLAQQELVEFGFHGSPRFYSVMSFISKGRILGSYEGFVRLSAAAILYCPHGHSDLTDAEREQLFTLLPFIMKISSLPDGFEDGDNHSKMDHLRLAMFHFTHTAGINDAIFKVLFEYGLAAAVNRRLDHLNTRKLDRIWSDEIGYTVKEVHRQLISISVNFLREGYMENPVDYKDVLLSDPKPEGTQLDLDERLVVALCPDVPDGTSIDVESLASPRGGWPRPIRLRPLYRSGRMTTAWDVRTLRRMMSNDFEEIPRALGFEHLVDRLNSTWTAALEGGLLDLSQVLPNPLKSPERLPPPREGQSRRNVDWIIKIRDHILMLEYKNLIMPESTFKTPSPEYYRGWLEGKFYKNQGFIQIRDNIIRCQGTSWTVDGLAIDDAETIWPICVVSVSFPCDPGTRRLLDELWAEIAPDLFENPKVAPPLLIGQEDLFRLLSGSETKVLKALKKLHMVGDEDSWLMSSYLHTNIRTTQKLWGMAELGKQMLLDIMHEMSVPEDE